MNESQPTDFEVQAIKEVILKQLMTNDIFPNKPFFDPKEAESLYVTKRIEFTYDLLGELEERPTNKKLTSSKTTKSEQEINYARLFDELFWKRNSSIIIVTGTPGCGKSTFIDHYFRSDCPYNDEHGRKNNFDHKLILTVNLRSAESIIISTFFYQSIRNQITEAYERLTKVKIEDDYEFDFYDPQYNWKKNQDLDENYGKIYGLNQEQVRRERTRECVLNDQMWVKFALTFLEKHPENFSYIVIVLDNLDQTSAYEQIQAIKLAQNLLANYKNLKLWKLILPLWPASVDTLLNKMNPELGRNSEIFKLPAVDTEEFFEKRFTQNLSVAETNTNSAIPPEIISWSQNYVRSFYAFGKREFFRLYGNLSGADLRMRQDLLLETLLNPTLRSRFKTKNNTFKGIGVYALFSALIAGRENVYDHTHNPILNVFNVVASTNSYSVLIGFHLLWLLYTKIRTNSFNSRIHMDEIIEDLRELQHDREEIYDALSFFRNKRILALIETDNATEYIIYQHAVCAHMFLLKKSSYIENMALVTPIHERQRNNFTKDEIDNFLFKKMYTLNFLDDVRLIESAYQDHLCKNEGNPLQHYKIPSLFETISNTYFENLEIDKKIPNLLERKGWNKLDCRRNEIQKNAENSFKFFCKQS